MDRLVWNNVKIDLRKVVSLNYHFQNDSHEARKLVRKGSRLLCKLDVIPVHNDAKFAVEKCVVNKLFSNDQGDS